MRLIFRQSEFPPMNISKHITSILLSAAAIAAFSSSALAANAPTTANSGDSIYDATRDEQDAQSASLKGDGTSEVALAGKAYREDPSLLNEFNLATGYERLGRTVLAIPLYQDLAVRGQYINVEAVYNYDSPLYAGVRARHMNSTLSAESLRRLNQIAGRPAPFNP
jgi:hypothetical protein